MTFQTTKGTLKKEINSSCKSSRRVKELEPFYYYRKMRIICDSANNISDPGFFGERHNKRGWGRHPQSQEV